MAQVTGSGEHELAAGSPDIAITIISKNNNNNNNNEDGTALRPAKGASSPNQLSQLSGKIKSAPVSSLPDQQAKVDEQRRQSEISKVTTNEFASPESQDSVGELLAQKKQNQQQTSNSNNSDITSDTNQNLGLTSTLGKQNSAPSEQVKQKVQLESSQSGAGHQPEVQPQQPFCKARQRHLSYLQTLLLRRWPCLALAICIMSSLVFGILLSAATVYLMHGVGDCSALARTITTGPTSGSGASGSLFHSEPLSRSVEMEAPLELASLVGTSSGHSEGRQYSSGAGEASQTLSQRSGQGSAAGSLALSSSATAFQRLPTALTPIHYDLWIQPYIAEPFNFSSKVSIHFRCDEPTNNVTLHAVDLEFNEASISLALAKASTDNNNNNANLTASQVNSGKLPKVKRLTHERQLQYIVFELDDKLERGIEYVISVNFTGFLNDDLAGFYKSKFERQNSNETNWIAITQFQATDARRAFPCFDEPIYKATFGIEIKHWKNMTALSNMPIINSRESDDGLWVTDTFEKTHRMSTYLVAYAVTNFESRSDGNISVWTRPGLAHTAEYALKIAGKILRHYEDFFGIKYPLPKLDMIALPDFHAGAMENWGLITYRESSMLYEEKTSAMNNKERVAIVVAHEIAHQWFGNLVTPKWWDDLWLNEGFASFVEFLGVDFVEPNWRIENTFINEIQAVFRLDGLPSTHQISIPVNNPDDISEIFDMISYTKGASIIRMMQNFLTDQVLRSGLQTYLHTLRYSNADQSDLWAHLTEALRKAVSKNSTNLGAIDETSVEKIMSSWTLQSGFPLVTLTRAYGAKRSAQLDQVRYQASKLDGTPSNSDNSSSNAIVLKDQQQQQVQRWEIPITLTWQSEKNWSPRTRIWMHQNNSLPVQLSPTMMPKSDDEWMILNINQVGFYRVNYDARNWKLLVDQLMTDHKQISTINRAQVMDDLFELARNGLIDYRFALDATRYLQKEQDYIPWESVLTSISYLEDMLQRTSLYGEWKEYVDDLISPVYTRHKEISWVGNQTNMKHSLASTLPRIGSPMKENNVADGLDPNDLMGQYTWAHAIVWACLNNKHCINKSREAFSTLKTTGKNNITPLIRYTVYCSAIENGDKDDWDFLWKIYEKEHNANERDRILRALACTKETWLLTRYLEWTFNKNKAIRRQDASYIFRVISRNNYGRDIAFNYLREKWPLIREYFGKSSFSLSGLVRSLAPAMNTQVELNELKNFLETIKSDVSTARRSFQIAIDEVESNIAWRNKYYHVIEEWLVAERKRKRASAA